VVTDATGCTVQTTVTITQPPKLIVSIVPGTIQICIGQSRTLTANTVGGTPSYAFLWNTGATTSSISVTPTTTSTYTITATDANGCTDTATCSVVVNQLPVATITASDTAACGSLCVTFGTTTTTIGATYSWNFGDGGTSNQQNPVYCYTTVGTFSVSLIVTSAAGCSATFTNLNYITIWPVPVAAFSANPPQATMMDPTIVFTNLSTGGTIYNWTYGDALGGSSQQMNPTYTYQDTGSHLVTLIVTNQYGCKDTATMIVRIDEEFTFYVPTAFTPNKNPINNVFIPKGVGIDEDHYEFWVFDRWGNMIFHTTKWGVGWDGRANGGSAIAQEDVYVWLVKLVVRSTQEDMNYVGHVTLIR
jgi:gliding motility-associated-like protein